MTHTSIKDISIGQECTLCGFVSKIREQKTMIFVLLRDRTGTVQIAVDKSLPVARALDGVTRESVLRVQGKVVKAENVKGGMEIVPEQIELESLASQIPIDEGSSPELRLDFRWLDLRDEKKRLIFEVRTFVEHSMREFFMREGFIEIHSPKISSQCSEGGADVFKIDYYGQKAYLTQSPQFYKQMAIASGFEKVFEIGDIYRAEKSFTSRHAAESVCVDFEIASVWQSEQVLCQLEKLMLYVLERVKATFGDKIRDTFGREVALPQGKIPRIKLCEVFEIFEREYGIKTPEAKRLDLDPEAEKLICKYAEEKLGSELVFIVDYPFEARAFYSQKYDEGYDCKSLDMLYRGWEMSSGAVREHRYERLKSQIEEKGIDPEKMAGYLEFFKYGCPPHGGIGMGIDRFVAKLLDLPSVKESAFIFRGPNRLTP